MRKYGRFLVALLVASAMVLLIDPLTGVGVSLSDALSRNPLISKIISFGLILIAAVECGKTLFPLNHRIPLRRALFCYAAFSFGMAGVYFFVHETGHDCFRFPDGQSGEPSVLDFVYFSFVTVTTVGYGDIIPKHTFVRGLVLLQVLFGLNLILRASSRWIGSKMESDQN